MPKKTKQINTVLISLHEASEETGHTHSHLNLLCRSGELKGQKIGRNWLVEKEKLAGFLASHKNGAKREISASDSEDKQKEDLFGNKTGRAFFHSVLAISFVFGLIFFSVLFLSKNSPLPKTFSWKNISSYGKRKLADFVSSGINDSGLIYRGENHAQVLGDQSGSDQSQPETGNGKNYAENNNFSNNNFSENNSRPITSGDIAFHAIEARNIDSNSVTSRTIRNHTITSKDLASHLTIQRLVVDKKLITDNAEIGTIDLGTNTISDGTMTGNWNFGSGNITTTGIISGVFAGAFAPSGDVDMINHVITNIGNSGTDFNALGGLTLANGLTVTTGGITATGNSSITGNLTINSGSLILGLNTLTTSNTTLVSNLNADYVDGKHATDLTLAYVTGNGGVTTTQLGFNYNSGAPFTVTNNTVVTNLNADLLDGQHGNYYAPLANINGTQNYISKFTSASAIGNSTIYDNGSVGIGTTNPTYSLDISGTFRLSSTAPVFGSYTFTIPATGTAALGTEALNQVAYWSTANTLAGENYLSLSRGGTGIGTTNPGNGKLLIGNGTNYTLANLSAGAGIGISNASGSITITSTVTGGGSGVVNSGTAGFFAYYLSSGTAVSGQSVLYTDGTNIGIGTTNLTSKFQIADTNTRMQLDITQDSGQRTNLSIYDDSGGKKTELYVSRVWNTAALFTAADNLELWAAGFKQATLTSSGLSFEAGKDINIDQINARSADGLKLYNDGGDGIFIKDDGNVGIGTTAPDKTLTVNGQGYITSGLFLGSTAPENYLSLGSTGSSSTVMYIGNGAIATGSGSLNQVAYWSGTNTLAGENYLSLSRGGTGIGTTSPANGTLLIGNGTNYTVATLTAGVGIGITNASGAITINTTNISSGTGTINYLPKWGTASSFSNSLLYDNGTSLGLGTTNPSGIFQVGIGATTPFFISSGGNVGIGTTTVGSRLVIKGSDATSSNSALNVTNSSNSSLLFVRDDGSVGIGTTSPLAQLEITSNSVGSYPPLLTFAVDKFGGSSGDAFVIDQYGSVGIGTTSPTQLLTINAGSILLSDTYGLRWGNGYAYINGYSESSTADRLSFFVGSEIMRMDAYGNVGIGTTGPKSKLDVNGGISVGSYAGTAAAPTNGVIISGSLGIGTTNPSYALDVIVAGTGPIAQFNNGSSNTGCTLNGTGVLTCTSDQRLKKNITDSSYGLNEIMGLRPVNYNWKGQSNGAQKSIGFIAQEVAGVLPQLVVTDANGYEELDTIGMVPVIVKGMQEQQTMISEQESVNREQELLIKSLNDNNISIDDKISIIGKNLSDINVETQDLASLIASQAQIQTQNSASLQKLQDQMKTLQDMNQAVIDFAKVFDPKMMVYKDSLGNLDLGLGKLTVAEIETQIIKTKEIDTEVLGVTGEKTAGKGTIKAGETEIIIETPYASQDAKISITPKGSTQSKTLYYDDVKEGESFKVKIDKPAIDQDINFDWLIIK